MSIPAFPSGLPAPVADMGGSVYLPQVRDEFENGSVASRKRATKEREKLSGLKWAIMTEEQYQTLRAFFVSVQGGTFTWVHPLEGKTYTLGSTVDDLVYTHISGGGRSVEWPCEER